MTHQQPAGHKGQQRHPTERYAHHVKRALERSAMAPSPLYIQKEGRESDGVYVAIKTCEFKAQPLTVVEIGGDVGPKEAKTGY